MRISTVRRIIVRPTAGICLLAVTAFGGSALPNTAIADIGITREQAEARVTIHTANHRGRYPLFETNENGIVVWECWEAPPEGWTKPQAMSLVKDLIPPALRSQTPRRAKPQAGGEMLVYQDGTTVWLEYSVPKALYRFAAVWTREYRGSEC